MNAFQKSRSGYDVFRIFGEMRSALCGYNAYVLSCLFNGLLFGINGDRRAGALKVVEIYTSLVTSVHLNHFVSTPILRALAEVSSPAQVDQFWAFCRQHLESSRQGWPGEASAKILSGCCSRSHGRGSWPRVQALLSGADACDGITRGSGEHAAGGVSRALAAPRAGGGSDISRAPATGRVLCKNWQTSGSCPFGDRCRYKDGHK